MSSLINWQVADSQAREARRIDAALDVHPFARLVALQFRPPPSRTAKTPPETKLGSATGTAHVSPCP
jgi:hypothetical protein